MNTLRRARIKVKGIVQGVGFRPTVYRHAQNIGVFGFVANTPEGVIIEAEGDADKLKSFIDAVNNEPPKMARITSVDVQYIPVNYSSDFVIVKSIYTGEKNTEISPDIAICPDCVDDILNTKDRRHFYAFTNCTNCGPRFTIVKDRPYDRKNTSMSDFKMCSDCEAEYEDPNNRRFHAQPNACPKCGPKLSLLSLEGFIKNENPIEEAVDVINQGKLVAIKSLGGFNIACDPFNKDTVLKLRDKKQRGSKAFALMMKDLAVVEKYCFIDSKEKEELLSSKAPIVLLRKKNNVFDNISPDNNYLGVMLPYTPLHVVLLNDLEALVMTSANKADEPLVISDKDIMSLINYGLVDVALTHNREIVNRCDDSIVQVIEDETFVIRRARGFAPFGIKVKNALSKDTLSLGADLKNTFALKKDDTVYLSQHIGDLDDVRNVEYQKEQIKELIKLTGAEPVSTTIDAHPGYANHSSEHKKVYHHHAHALSCMAENNLLGNDVLGVICDGTGYGEDGNIWGFEFLDIKKDYKQFSRIYSLDHFCLPGGEKAIFETDRVAVSLIKDLDLSEIPNIDLQRKELIEKLIKTNVNCPLTSSLGRLFDGVSALCGISLKSDYEAQSAIILQKYAEKYEGVSMSSYTVNCLSSTIDYRPMIKELVIDIKNRTSVNEIAFKFHSWVCDSIVAVIKRSNPENIVFSGGCFQNSLLVVMLVSKLKEHDIGNYYFNKEVPTNDAGISFGQSVV